MSVTEASHTQRPSRGMRAWKKKTSLWQWGTARCGGRMWIRSRLPGPPDDDELNLQTVPSPPLPSPLNTVCRNPRYMHRCKPIHHGNNICVRIYESMLAQRCIYAARHCT